MDRQQLLARIEEIEQAINQAAAHHSSLVVRLDEARYLLQMMDKKIDELVKNGEVVTAADDAVVEGVAS